MNALDTVNKSLSRRGFIKSAEEPPILKPVNDYGNEPGLFGMNTKDPWWGNNWYSPSWKSWGAGLGSALVAAKLPWMRRTLLSKAPKFSKKLSDTARWRPFGGTGPNPLQGKRVRQYLDASGKVLSKKRLEALRASNKAKHLKELAAWKNKGVMLPKGKSPGPKPLLDKIKYRYKGGKPLPMTPELWANAYMPTKGFNWLGRQMAKTPQRLGKAWGISMSPSVKWPWFAGMGAMFGSSLMDNWTGRQGNANVEKIGDVANKLRDDIQKQTDKLRAGLDLTAEDEGRMSNLIGMGGGGALGGLAGAAVGGGTGAAIGGAIGAGAGAFGADQYKLWDPTTNSFQFAERPSGADRKKIYNRLAEGLAGLSGAEAELHFRDAVDKGFVNKDGTLTPAGMQAQYSAPNFAAMRHKAFQNNPTYFEGEDGKLIDVNPEVR